MTPVSLVGLVLSVGGFVGYVVGVLAPYPGRAFSLTALMVGLTVLAVGMSGNGEEDP
ncbi:hypothetical protein [Haloarcula marina]|uniref:hypothetical protein n=1 Tax=Haloarcula marina TaxID=2961574 RepID=UPI0020B7BD89|nr:hypothetical protein [Halomicroarcula marina]